MRRPRKPGRTVKRAKALRRKLTPPEIMLWRHLKGPSSGIWFRKQHPAGDFILDFFCARANLAIEVDGFAHDCGDRPARDSARDAWLLDHRIETVRIPAGDVFRDAHGVAQSIVSYCEERLRRFGKAPASVLRAATSPSQVDGEDVGVSA